MSAVNETSAEGRPSAVPIEAGELEPITFFNPDRPVENGTVNVLPEGTAPEGETLDRAARAAMETFHVPSHPLYGWDTTSQAYRELWRQIVRSVAVALSAPDTEREG